MRKQILENALALVWSAWRRRYLICIPILLMPIVASVVGVISPKKYESYTTILIQEAAKQNPFLKDLTVATNLSDRMDALNALLHSRHVLADVAFKLGTIDRDTPNEDAAREIGELSRNLRATLVGDDLIKIYFTSKDPSRMEETLRLVSLRFVERVIAPQRSSIMNSESFLEKELNERRAELITAEQNLAAYKSEFASELPDLHSSNVVRLANLKQALATKKTEMQGAEVARSDLKQRMYRTNPVVGKIEEKIVNILSDLAVLRSRYTDNHTRVQAALRKLSSLEEERAKALTVSQGLKDEELERLWSMAANSALAQTGAGDRQPLLVSQLERLQEAESKALSLAEEVRSTEEEIAKLESKVSGFGEHERRLGELDRDLRVKRKIYEDLAERHQLARVTGKLGKSEESEQVKLIDPPFTPSLPSNLPVFVFTVLGVFAGIALGIGLAVVAEIIDLTIWRRRQLAQITDVPVITRIPPLGETTPVFEPPAEEAGAIKWSEVHA